MDIQRSTTATPDEVFAVLEDGWVFPTWVVGAARIRAVDDEWPGPGARLHHSFGVWPAVVDDETEVIVNQSPNRLMLQARGWPMGEATVDIRIDAWQGGSLVTITEDVTKGPGTLVPMRIRQALIGLRNRETIRRLILLAEGRAGKTDLERHGLEE